MLNIRPPKNAQSTRLVKFKVTKGFISPPPPFTTGNGICVDIDSFLHNTVAKMCLPSYELNNVGVGLKKQVKYW